MDNQNIGRISIDSANRPRARFNLRHDVNTTASFGDCQPIVCRECIAGTKSVLSVDTLVRLAPMVAPTRSRVGVRFLSKFVGMSELTENYPAFMSQQKITRGALSFVPQKMPYVSLKFLSAMVLSGCRMTFYRMASDGVQDDSGDSVDITLQKAPSSAMTQEALNQWNSSIRGSWQLIQDNGEWDLVNILNGGNFWRNAMPQSWLTAWGFESDSSTHGVNIGRLLSFGFDFWVPSSNANPASFFMVDGEDWEPVSLEGADIVLPVQLEGVGSEHGFFACVKLSAFGSRLRKALIGCGYQLDFLATRDVALFPLFAYYKSYYDSFGLMLYENWENNPVTRMMRWYDDNNTPDFVGLIGDQESTDFRDWWVDFIRRLGLAFYSEEQDFVSAHIRDLAVSPDPLAAIPALTPNVPYHGDHVTSGDHQDQPPSVDGQSGHSFVSFDQSFSQLDLELLRKAYQVTNRNTIAGKRIAEILRANGQGKYVDECKSTFVGESYVPIDVSDVNATADTSNEVTGQSSVLGEYTGKGIGYEESKTWTYENDEYGYLVVIGVVIPESGYTQQIDASILNISKEDFYNPDYDGMGFEANSKRFFVGQNDFPDGSKPNALDATFGFISRYSRHKVAPNKINGNFSKRSARMSFLPYTLDKFIEVGEREIIEGEETSGGKRYQLLKSFEPDKLPCATPSLRFVGRFPWLGFLNRIFNNYGKKPSYYDYSFRNFDESDGSPRSWEFTNDWDDNFMLFNFVNLVQYAPMLPIEDSFETREDGNKGKTDVSIGKA